MAESPLPIEIDCESVQSLQAGAEPFLLLDCREQDEYETARIEGASLLPMSELQKRLDELQNHRESRIVVHCHHGGRSLRVANWLRGQGYLQAQSMAGGIDAWALRIDSSVPRY